MRKSQVALYLDAPDELVDLDRPVLWRNVQQGLLLAVWQFSKSAAWGTTLSVHASVRSEAFGTDHDHPNVRLAMSLVMPLRYESADLRAILVDKIRSADIPWLHSQLAAGEDPIHALCGFSVVCHEDRLNSDGSCVTEDVFAAILRHTRSVPREIVALGAAIYAMGESRTAATVRSAVNSAAGASINEAIQHSFLGWSESVHARFALAFPGEAMSRQVVDELATSIGGAGEQLRKFFVRHGLLGYSEQRLDRHRYRYRQRFEFDELGANVDAVAFDHDFYFLHPALKQWVLSRSERGPVPLVRWASGVIGDMQHYEARPPHIHLGIGGAGVTIRLDLGPVAQLFHPRNPTSQARRALFVALCAYRRFHCNTITLAQMLAVWRRLQDLPALPGGLPGDALFAGGLARVKLTELAKRINRDSHLKQLQERLRQIAPLATESNLQSRARRVAKSNPFLSVCAPVDRDDGALVSFPDLPIDEVDWDEALERWLKADWSAGVGGVNV